jgi:hypothetical protein
MSEGALVTVAGQVARFLLGVFLGVLGLVGGAWVLFGTLDFLSGEPPFEGSRLVVDGAELTRRGGTVLRLASDGRDLRLTCRETCDNLEISPPRGRPRIRVLNASAACVLCGRDALWATGEGGARVLAGRTQPLGSR